MVTPVAEGGFQTPASYSTSAPTQRAIAAGDFNGDGTVDLVVSEGFAADVLLGNGDGTFRRAVNYQIGVGASSAITAVVADFNGDGIADLAFGGNSPWVYLLYGNGDGTFRTGPTVSISSEMAGPFVSGMVAGDFNNDGIADLAAANYTENVMIVLLGKGDGTFQPAVSYPAGVQPVSIASGDLNGDGHPDLVVVSNAGNSVITFSGAGDGTFHAFGSYAVGTWPVSVTMADFNRDGRLDIAVANAQGNTVSVLLGNGNGSFQPAVNYAGGTSPASILAADFNGDGKVDLAIATSGAIVLLAGNGDGTFQPLVRYGITWGTQAIALGDFNGDGRVDLAFLASVPGIGGVGIMIGKTPLSGEPMPASRTGVFRKNIAFLEDSNGNETYDAGVDRFIPNFTGPGGFVAGDVPVVGDWTGDGNTKVGIYRTSTGTWYLDANNNGVFDAGDFTYHFGGLAGDMPFVGDWMGLGKSCVGIYRTGSLWLLDLNCSGTFDNTPTDAFFPYGGLAGDVPVVGAWTGGGTRVGVVRKYAPGGVPIGEPFYWVPDAGVANAGNDPANHPPDVAHCFAFGGLAGDVFVTGDWYGKGVSQAGVYRAGYWVLDAAAPGASQSSHVAGFAFGYGGVPGDVPVVGKW